MSSYGKATPYLPIIDLLKAYFQVEPDDGRGMHEQVADKLLALDEALRRDLDRFESDRDSKIRKIREDA